MISGPKHNHDLCSAKMNMLFVNVVHFGNNVRYVYLKNERNVLGACRVHL